MKIQTLLSLSILCFLFSCTSEVEMENNLNELIDEIENTDDPVVQTGPVIECSEHLSAVEMKEVWERMNPATHEGKAICFEGYVLSNETFGDLIQGSVAFKPFTEEDVVIPSAVCEFSGLNKNEFENYEIGEKIEIMGIMKKIDDPSVHNFMISDVSLPDRDGEQ